MPSLPVPALILLGTAAESLLITNLVPIEYLPTPPFSRVYVRLLILQLFLYYVVYGILIYPYTTPLQSVPSVPGGLPFVGNGRAMMERPAGKSPLTWMKTIPNDGLIMFRGPLGFPRLLVTNPQALAELLVTRVYDFEKPPPLRNFLRTILGEGLIIVEGDVHKFQRKHIMPVFTFRHIKDLHSIFWSKSMQLTQGIAQQLAEKPSADQVVEINHWANQVTMDIIGLAAMGRDFQALKSGDDPLVHNYEILLQPTREMRLYFLMNMMLPSQRLIRFLPWPIIHRVDKVCNDITTHTLDLVRQKKEMMRTEKPDSQSKDILSLLIRSNNFDDRQLADQMLTFLAAGHETTSSAFTWTTYLLAKHPHIQKALREEIHKYMPSPANQSSADETDIASILDALPILNGVCQEVIRLYPTVPITVRESNKETQLVGQKIPKGIHVILSPYATNRDPQLWGSDAEEFKPERWIDTDEKTGERRPNKNGGAPTNYAILTFLHGPRSCIGQGFAQAELRCLIAAFVGSYEIEMANPDEEIEVSGTITTKPKNGMHLRLKYLGNW